jgi:hypothetical protein
MPGRPGRADTVAKVAKGSGTHLAGGGSQWRRHVDAYLFAALALTRRLEQRLAASERALRDV